MLPAATPPNTIVFGSERLTIRDMMRGGIGLNLLCAFLVTLAALTFAARIFGF
jgi:sodium-dependent dicarboxylate transporter 2/3/5